jgi:hypothetical protein
MRSDIDRHPRRLKDVLLLDGMRKEFLGGISNNDAKAVKAFVSANAENALKTRPKVRTVLHTPMSVKCVAPWAPLRSSMRYVAGYATAHPSPLSSFGGSMLAVHSITRVTSYR